MNIYFSGSIRAGREDQEWYGQIINELSRFGQVLTEHIASADLGHMARMPDAAIYEQDMKWLGSADVLVAEVTNPSLGVGYALRAAEELGIPVLCLFNEDSERRLSAMIAGNPNLGPRVIRYGGHDPAMLTAYLAKFMRELGT